MSKKLYLYSIILAIVYVVFFCRSVYESVENGIAGGKLAFRELIDESGKSRHLKYEVFGINLKPSKGIAYFPSTILNEKTQEKMRIEIREAMVFTTQTPDTIPLFIRILKIFTGLAIFISFGIFCYIPIVAYKILKSIPKEEFYSITNINRMRKSAFLILAIFFLMLIASFFNCATSAYYMQLENYRLTVKITEYPLLFLGLVLLIMSEILRYTTNIKEEQALTI